MDPLDLSLLMCNPQTAATNFTEYLEVGATWAISGIPMRFFTQFLTDRKGGETELRTVGPDK